MLRRWIIRGFFIGLLVLLGGGWLGSYKVYADLTYGGGHSYALQVNYGDLRFWSAGDYGFLWMPKGWNCSAEVYTGESAFNYSHGHSFLGFFFERAPELNIVIIPFWFPATISAVLLWWVWRKTRPKTKGRAFPVEISEAIVQTSKAE